ncbi:hypothetical protein Vadar_024383 [Vaccinium darrowii]|uniref:Uncharacterized protein n=1 Tax=Vaccinium darrowii TaxID=229202 RepID=A0ACB7ZEV5_9ERIC|nr:hypothetical protein Vadar_024383 [Vaccinium darrowii]
MGTSLKVAVIGAGVSGLVAARELLREGHRVVVYEKSNQLGGIWVYDPRIESDPLGLDPNREIVHSSLYASLRTNLPRHLMSFSDYPFTDRLIRFDTEVVRVERVNSGDDDDEWVVKSRTIEGSSDQEEFQAVVVCTGHYTEPIVANLPGIEKWPGKQVHSHNYRVPDPFQNQVVVMIGSGPSALDIYREIASVAKQVHLSSRSPNVEVSKVDNIWQHLENLGDHSKSFEEISCQTSPMIGGVPSHEPSDDQVRISIELQSKWIASVLSGKTILPSKEEMLANVEQHYKDMENQGIPKHHTHRIKLPEIEEYLDMTADLAGVPTLAERTKEIQRHFLKFVVGCGLNVKQIRDEWDPNTF